MAEIFLGVAVLAGWAGLRGQLIWTWTWVCPVVLLSTWAAVRFLLRRRGTVWRTEFGLGLSVVGVGILLPAWPGASTGAVQALVVAASLLAAWGWSSLARLAEGPAPGRLEQGRIFLLLLVQLATWWAYFTPNLMGVVDERWYGDLMTDFLGQIRAGEFPVLVGQGEYAWNGNVHPFRSAPWHHYCGALVDIVTLGRLTPLAVQHVVLLVCEFAAVFALYVGLRRMRPERPWLALLIGLLLALCPAITLSQVQHDMYMTVAALPVVVFIALALVRALESNSWQAWGWLGAGLGAVWFCHPPVALLTSGTVGLTLVFWLVAGPVEKPTLFRMGLAGMVFAATAAGYFVSMGEISPLRNGHGAMLEQVVVPGVAIGAIILGWVSLGRARGAVAWGFSAGALVVGAWLLVEAQPMLTIFTVMMFVTALAWTAIGRCFPRVGLFRFSDLFLLGATLMAGATLGPWLAGDATIDAWLEAARKGYAQLWLPLRHGGTDQLGVSVLAGFVFSVWAAFRTPNRVTRALILAVLVLMLLLAPIPGFSRFAWQVIPRDVIDVISVAYPLRFLPVTAPFCLIVTYLVLAELSVTRTLRLVVCFMLAWSLWEHGFVVAQSWRFRHSTEATQKHLRSENRAISRFHYDLMPLVPQHQHGVADYRLETRLWPLNRGAVGGPLGPDEQAGAIARIQGDTWQDAIVTQDPLYPSWLYLAPRIMVAPGERRLVSFDWQGGIGEGWLIMRSKNIYRDYRLPVAGGYRGFGQMASNHRTLSVWNSGPETEEVELVIKREGIGADEPLDSQSPQMRLLITDYHPADAPVEVVKLVPLQLRLTTAEETYVETFRVWQPGYRVSIDAKPVRCLRSPHGLVAFVVPAGKHIADVRFRGTPGLRIAVKWSLFVGSMLLLALVLQGVRLMRWPNRPA